MWAYPICRNVSAARNSTWFNIQSAGRNANGRAQLCRKHHLNLASLPDFLRRPILKKRMTEFFTLSGPEKQEIISNALEAGPDHSVLQLFQSCLDVAGDSRDTFRKGERGDIAAYLDEVSRSPLRLVRFHLDGILGIFLEMDGEKRGIISRTVRVLVSRLPADRQRRILLVMPDSARTHLGI